MTLLCVHLTVTRAHESSIIGSAQGNLIYIQKQWCMREYVRVWERDVNSSFAT